MSGVSRSVYQKVCEENKRIINDIHILVGPVHDIFYQKTIEKWRKKFKDENDFYLELKLAAKQYMKDHPEIELPKI
jgi:hemerythrin